MARQKGGWTATSFAAANQDVLSQGARVTGRGEERVRKGQGLHPSVDPKTHDSKRESLNLLIPHTDGTYLLRDGIAMPVKNDLDGTGSMDNNIDIAFKVLPDLLHLLVEVPNAPLKRYHTQIANGIVQDRNSDRYPYQHTEFEPDNVIGDQMRNLVGEKGGNNDGAEYQLGLAYAAQRIVSTIWNYGLKGYYFVTGDEKGHNTVVKSEVERILGYTPEANIATKLICKEATEKWHIFYLQVGTIHYATSWWSELIGAERCVILPRTNDLALVQATIIGLTEGTFDLQDATDFLRAEANVSLEVATRVTKAVANIPLRAQADLPGFDEIPLAGSIFASKNDIWPINADAAATPASNAGDIDWKL